MHNGFPVAYFDGPGGTQVPRAVAEAMNDYLFHHNANTHWAYPTSAETDQLIADSRQAVADFFNCEANEISFGANMTTITFHVARALGRGYNPGDEIIITELDHHANNAPWQALAKERGVTVRTVRMLPETGQLDWDDLAGAINRNTRLLAIGAASNALGTINDVQYAARLAHEAGALVYVDAVHYAPHALVDVRDLECDFLACSAYKFYGPHIGALYGRYDLLERLDVPKLEPAPSEAPERLETGTQNHEGMVGTAAAIDFLASLSQGATRRERLRNSFAALHAQRRRPIQANVGWAEFDRRRHALRPRAGRPAHADALIHAQRRPVNRSHAEAGRTRRLRFARGFLRADGGRTPRQSRTGIAARRMRLLHDGRRG